MTSITAEHHSVLGKLGTILFGIVAAFATFLAIAFFLLMWSFSYSESEPSLVRDIVFWIGLLMAWLFSGVVFWAIVRPVRQKRPVDYPIASR